MSRPTFLQLSGKTSGNVSTYQSAHCHQPKSQECHQTGSEVCGWCFFENTLTHNFLWVSKYKNIPTLSYSEQPKSTFLGNGWLRLFGSRTDSLTPFEFYADKSLITQPVVFCFGSRADPDTANKTQRKTPQSLHQKTPESLHHLFVHEGALASPAWQTWLCQAVPFPHSLWMLKIVRSHS